MAAHRFGSPSSNAEGSYLGTPTVISNVTM